MKCPEIPTTLIVLLCSTEKIYSYLNSFHNVIGGKTFQLKIRGKKNETFREETNTDLFNSNFIFRDKNCQHSVCEQLKFNQFLLGNIFRVWRLELLLNDSSSIFSTINLSPR